MMNPASALNEAINKSNYQRVVEILNSPNAYEIVNAEDNSKYTPIFFACMHQDEEFGAKVVSLLLEKGADPLKIDVNVETIIFYLAKDGKDKILSMLIPKYKYNLNADDYMKQTPIFWAASKNHKTTVAFLLQHGADINHLDSNMETCLYYAASGGHLQMCKLLVNRGADFQISDKNGETPIQYARKNKHRAIVDYFNWLKSNLKKQKQVSIVESSQQQSKGNRKKKELMKQEYCLVYTNERGQIHELTMEEIEKFGDASDYNQSIMKFIRNPQKLDNEQLPEEKKFQKTANKILTHFMKHQQGYHFAEPLDIVALNIPTYPQIVKKPMDFSTIKTKLNFNAYDSEDDFYSDMNLVFDNCILFNGIQSQYGKIGMQMKLEFNTMFKKQFMI